MTVAGPGRGDPLTSSSAPTAATAAPPRPTLLLEALDWRRIQLRFRLRPDGDMPVASDVRLALVRVNDGPGADESPIRVAPTRAAWEEGALVARFNVMQGPGQQPLAAGRWRLVAAMREGAAGAEERAIEIADPGALVDGVPVTAFATPRGSYAVAVRYHAPRGLTLDVSLDRGAAAGAPSGGRARRGARSILRRLARRLRRAAFRSTVGLVRWRSAGAAPAILFTSSTRPALGGNLAAVHDRMLERGLLRDVKVLFSFKPDLHERTPWRERLRLPVYLGRSDVIVIDDFHPVVGALDDPRIRIVQLWHASGVVKTILYSRVGKADSPDPWSRDYKNATFAIVSSAHDVPHFAEAFGIPEARVVPTGIPRMDRFFDEAARARGRDAALDAYPAARGRRVILFAPTFRGSGRTKSYDLEALDYPALHALCVEKDAVFVIRLHPRMHRSLDIPEALRDRLIDGSDVATDAPDILLATDLLITDYSSIIFEFAILGRPMLFFAPDLDAYREAVDFYEPYESLVPGKVVRTMPELVEAIRTEDFEAERLAAFTERHIAHLDGQATDRVIDQLILPGLRSR